MREQIPAGVEHDGGSQVVHQEDGHWSDCAVHNGPALPVGPCDCGRSAPRRTGGDGGSEF